MQSKNLIYKWHKREDLNFGTMAPNFIAPVSQYFFFQRTMVTLEDFLTDLYSLFDQKVQKNLVFYVKINRNQFLISYEFYKKTQ